MIAEKRTEIEKINLRLQRLLDSFLDAVIERDEYTAEKIKLMSQKKSLEGQNTTFRQGKPIGSNRSQNGYYPLKTRVKLLFQVRFKRSGVSP